MGEVEGEVCRRGEIGVRTRVKSAERGCEGGGLGWREGERGGEEEG